MYPYSSKLRWIILGRHTHLVDALENRPELLEGHHNAQLWARMKILKRWLKVRLAAMTILSFSAIATILGLILDELPSMAEAEAFLRLLRRVAGSLVGLATVLYFLATRILGQAEIDALLLLHQHNHEFASNVNVRVDAITSK